MIAKAKTGDATKWRRRAQALELEVQRLKRELERASRDPLTSLMRRELFERAVKKELLRIERSPAEHCVLLFIDVNGLKKINDTGGHEKGDKALVSFADFLRMCLRGYETICRWGGDEFLVLVPRADLKQGYLLRERILAELATLRKRTKIVPGVSIGVSSSSEGLCTFEKLRMTADKRLYKEKFARNSTRVLAPV